MGAEWMCHEPEGSWAWALMEELGEDGLLKWDEWKDECHEPREWVGQESEGGGWCRCESGEQRLSKGRVFRGPSGWYRSGHLKQPSQEKDLRLLQNHLHKKIIYRRRYTKTRQRTSLVEIIFGHCTENRESSHSWPQCRVWVAAASSPLPVLVFHLGARTSGLVLSCGLGCLQGQNRRQIQKLKR